MPEEEFHESEQMPPDWSPDLSPCSFDSPEDEVLESPVEEEEVMFGSQARLPYLRYTQAGGRDEEEKDQLLWDPNVLPECEVEVYLSQVAEHQHGSGDGASQERGLVRDNEQALYELVKCRFHTEEALRRLCFNVKVVRDGFGGWSEEERRNFEHGFRAHGKNFHLIQANKVRTRSVGECVQYYYSWKLSERFEFFTQSRMGRRKLVNQTSTECEFDIQESERPVQESERPAVLSERLSVNAAVHTDGLLNCHYTTCTCDQDQCSCRLDALSDTIHEDQPASPPLTSDLICLDVPPPVLPMLSSLKGHDSPLTASFSVADLGVLSLPDFLSPPSFLCTTSHPP